MIRTSLLLFLLLQSSSGGSGNSLIVLNRHYVSLTWNAPLTGCPCTYNLYRGSVSGGPYSLKEGNISSLNTTDSDVRPNQTYYYVATSVNSQGESINSNEASATIPP